MRKDKQKDKIEYDSYSFRLNKQTIKLLQELKVVNGKSWNLFFYEIAKEHANENKYVYRRHFALTYRKFLKDSCEKCGHREPRLGVHHIDGDITNSKPENLQTLCSRCHGKQYPR